MSNLIPPANAQIKFKKVSLSSAQILSLNSTPVELLPAPGAGKVISVAKVVAVFTYGTATYVSAGNLNVVQGANNIVQFGGLITNTADVIKDSAPSSATVLENTALDVTVTVGDPTTGDGTLDFEIFYYEVEL